MDYIGHLDGGRIQPLIDHLEGVARLASQFGSIFGVSKEAYIIGINHDNGKYSDAFQRYIKGEKKTRVDHSTAGAQRCNKHRELGNLSILAAFSIAGHHSGIPNYGSVTDESDEGTLCGRMKKQVPEVEDRLEHKGVESVDLSNLKRFGQQPMDMMLLTRMLYSCLVDADFLDTESFMSPQKTKRSEFPSIANIAEVFFKELAQRGYLNPKNKLNQKRYEILSRCIEKGEGPAGAYTLTVPTGGGKTISSMAFALRQAVKHNKKRIIYVIPYISIIDQTASIFKDFLGKEAVLECHSQVNYDTDAENLPQDKAAIAEKMKLAAENWDAPVIITTNEQFWESLYSNKPSKCRKLHNIVDSVIIYDEAQMLPVDFLKPCLCALQDLVRYYGCTTVLCSATQPALEKYMDLKPVEIMEEIPALYDFFSRVSYKVDGEKTYDDIATAMNKLSQVLCVASTKKEAAEIYSRMDGENLCYLSTNLCPAHRKKVIRDIRERLKKGLSCRVVSTSIISVGVDIDFPTVYLEYTGLDALIQGAGRCNREGKHSRDDSIAHVFWTEKNRQSKFMSKEKQSTDLVIRQFGDENMTSPEAIDTYFRRWYESNNGNLDYKGIEELSNKFAFADIGKKFRLIGDETKAVFILPYDARAREIHELLWAGCRTREIMREAGQYIINVRAASSPHSVSEFMQLYEAGKIAMYPNDEELAYLVDESAYDDVMGLVYEPEDGIAIIL